MERIRRSHIWAVGNFPHFPLQGWWQQLDGPHSEFRWFGRGRTSARPHWRKMYQCTLWTSQVWTSEHLNLRNDHLRKMCWCTSECRHHNHCFLLNIAFRICASWNSQLGWLDLWRWRFPSLWPSENIMIVIWQNFQRILSLCDVASVSKRRPLSLS